MTHRKALLQRHRIPDHAFEVSRHVIANRAHLASGPDDQERPVLRVDHRDVDVLVLGHAEELGFLLDIDAPALACPLCETRIEVISQVVM